VRIGIDLGGTKAEGVCLGDDGTILARHRIATPTTGYQAVLEAVAGLVHSLEETAGCVGKARVGVATPGFLAPRDGRLRNSNLAALNGAAIDRDLSERIGRPVRVANDANCFTLSEASDGAGTGKDVVFGVIVGTGCGGGVVFGGKLYRVTPYAVGR